MSTPSSAMTAEELLHYKNEPYRQELIDGRLHEMDPPGAQHGAVAMNVGILLGAHARQHDLGRVFAAETGFHLRSDPDTVRAPDASFVRQERIDEQGIPAGYLRGAPDLAVEVVSPTDREPQVVAKALDWVASGAVAAVILDPPNRTATVYRQDTAAVTLEADDTLDLGDVVPGFAVQVAELFT